MGTQADAGAARGDIPGKEGAAIHGVLEPIGIWHGGAIEEDLDGLLLLAREFADLERARVGGGAPVDMAGAFESFIGTDAVEVVSSTAIMSGQFTGEVGEQFFETGVRFDGRIDENVALEGYQDAAFGKSEGESGGELKAVFSMSAAAGEAEIDGLFQALGTGNDGEVKLGGDGAAVGSGQVDGEGRNPSFGVGDDDEAGDRLAGGDMFGDEEVQLEAGEGEAADESRDHQRCKHGGQQEEEQVVGRGEGSHTHQ